MLAKTSADDGEALAWYARVSREAAAGATDVLGLAAAADAWRAPRLDDPVDGLHLLAQAWKAGHRGALIDIRRLAGRLLNSEQTGADTLAACAKDALARQILNISVFTALDGDCYIDHDGGHDQNAFPYAGWLAALEAHGPDTIERADRIAWALYAWGDYPAAKRWLGRADKSEPRAQWLMAKFALREGKLNPAARALERAVATASRQSGWAPANRTSDSTPWLDTLELRSVAHGKLLADAGQIHMARGEFLMAMRCFIEADYREDAAYVAENVLGTDELVSHVRRHHPAWSPEVVAWWAGKPADGAGGGVGPPPVIAADATDNENDTDCLLADAGDAMRYLLGRRLAREFRFREARGFLPAPLLPLFDRFVELHRAARSGGWHGRDLAAIHWHLALVRRHFGMELFGTDGAPDGKALYDGSFEIGDVGFLRSHRDGWKPFWEMTSGDVPAPTLDLSPSQRAIPRVTTEEIQRVRRHAVNPPKRFHYRYGAADEAWLAASCLPDNDNSQAYILNTAGQWLAARDPLAADRFYKSLVRRNRNTPAGQAADQRRWFLSIAKPPDMPAVPALSEGGKRRGEITPSSPQASRAPANRPPEVAAMSHHLAERTGLEPATSGVTGRRSNQLSYRSVMGRAP